MGKRSEQYHEFQYSEVSEEGQQLALLNSQKREIKGKKKRRKNKEERQGNVLLRGDRG